MKLAISLSALLGVHASEGVFTYEKGSLDWVNMHNYCGVDHDRQSPINLLPPLGSYGYAYDKPIDHLDDKPEKSY